MSHQNATVTREIVSSVKFLVILCVLSFTVNADTSSATDSSTPLGLQPGAPAGAYALSDFDSVNLFNGNLSFQLSLLGISGRGTAQIPVLLPIEGKWRVIDIALPQLNGSFKHRYLPMQSWWENNDRKYRPGSLIGRQGSFDEFTCPDNTTVYSATLRRLTFTAPDGTEYELRDLLTGGQVMGGAGCNWGTPPSRGKVFVTADGSAATFVSDSTIYDYVLAPNPEAEFFPSGYLLLRDGTRFRIQSGRVEWMRDRNGNKLMFGYDSNNRVQTITDSLNRVVTISRNTGPGTFDQITYKGFDGAQRVVKVNYSSLASALRSDYPSTATYKALFPALNGSSTSYHNPSVVSSITLPNNQQYLIKYSPYGEIARVVLPTGGAIEYDYAAGAGDDESGAFGGGYEGSWVVYRRVVERRVYSDGGTTYSIRMTYSRSDNECAGCVKMDQLNSSGVLISRSKHYFYGNAAMSFATGPTDYSGWQEGREYQTEEFASDGASILRKTVNTWQQPMGGASWPLGQAETNASAKSHNPQITQTVTTQEPLQANKVSKQTFIYDKYTNRTDVYEYDFGTGTAGSLLRRTRTNYLTSSYDTLNPSATNPDLNLTSHLRSLPTEVSVFDAAGVERGRVTTEYDNYTLDGSDCLHSFHCALLSRPNISGFDSFFTASYTKRGNPTAVTHYLLTNGAVTSSVTSYSQYDVAGNVVRVLDPRSTLANNIATTLEYDDRYGIPSDDEARSNTAPTELAGLTSFAFPTKVTNALGHTSYAQFDYYLGQPVNGEDANGTIANGYFNDSLDRPTQIRRAVTTTAASQTTFAYDDATRTITTSSDKDAFGGNVLVSKVLYDQMGRTVETRQYEGSGNFIATQTQYDALGRAFKTSNPFRQSETVIWTTQAFDALGRVVALTTPDNAVVATSYSGNTVTVTDQAGKARKSVTDALGRLIAVHEDPSGVNYQTSYQYDVLDNLVKVTQDSQQRFFMYDSLKRLLRARNPEQSTHPSLNLSDSLTGNSAWSNGYEYDVGGNLTKKTDAHGAVTNYQYDLLNRNTLIDYPSGTPDVGRQYDFATNGKGLLNHVWQNDNVASSTYIDSYDPLGRPLVQRQRFGNGGVWSASYQTSRTYNLAGAVTSQTYPSGHTVTYTYDAAGRTASFGGNLGDGTQRSYASSFLYSPRNQVTQELFGTQTPLYHKLQYNIRGQLWDVRVATGADVNGSWNRGCLQFFYDGTYSYGGSGPDNNGNVRESKHYVPLDEQVSNWAIHDQVYDYDPLNRLSWVKEYYVSNTQSVSQQSQQTYTYDRWGNRTINAAQTWGTGINNKQFTVDIVTNRLGVPNGQPGVMSYDAAGNLITDTDSGAGIRTYDAENRMTTAADNTGQTSRYTYDADGKRVRRQVALSAEQWQIYGFDGELLAEYQAGAAVTLPEKEYGYRDGQLLITATGRFNVALAANGAVATASSTATGSGFSTTGAINGNYRGPWGNGEGWNDNTPNSVPDWIQIDFAGSKLIDEISVFSLYDNYTIANTPTETQTFTLYGLLAFDVQYWNGSSWVTVPGGSVTGNNKVWRKFTFSPVTTTKIRVVINSVPDSWSRVVEIQAFGTSASGEKVQWLVPDHLGTPRIILDNTGALANVKRHDYLPFGEELFAPAGNRTTAQGYSSGDAIRQQFTQKERDIETGLDYFGARYYSSVQGRFTSADDFLNDTAPIDPASWNLYAYVRNNPLRYIDPTGERIYAGELNDYEQAELLKRLNYTYGCAHCVSVGTDGFVSVDTAGLSNDVLKATAYLTDAINSNDASKLFSVQVSNDNADVAFGNAQIGMAGVQLPGNNFKTSAIRIRLDFGDDKWVSGDKAAKEAFLNTVFAHEVAHFYPNALKDPANPSETGPVVDIVNEIQQARGMPLRAEYGAFRRDRNGEFLSIQFGEARTRGGNIVRNSTGGIQVNKTNKIITWTKRTVGGKGVN